MRHLLIAIFIILFASTVSAQRANTSHKGLRFFPGHLDISITENDDTVRYELFNHWYSWSYAELRQISIPTSEVENWNQNDSLNITLHKSGNFKLRDKRYKLNRKIKHGTICTSTENMRKISFAYRISKMNGLGHLELYEHTDLKLTEEEFQELVLTNLNEIEKEQK